MENKVMAGFNVTKWRQVTSAAITFSLLMIPAISPPAHAASVIYQKLGAENYDPAGEVRYDHESRSMLVRIFDDNKDLVIVTLAFASNVSSTTFSSSSTMLRLKFMPSLTNFRGNVGNIWLEAPKVPYQGATKIAASASSYVSATSSPNDPRKDMRACGALTWMDDVPARNLVSFQFSRECFDLPNSFWAVSQIETDIYNSTTIKDVRYTPIEPFLVDLSSIPRPPKVIPKKDQTITANTQQREYFVNNPPIQIVANSSAGTALTFSSKTPEVCNVTSSGSIEPKASGSCQIAVDAAGSLTLNPAPTVAVVVSFTKKSQLLYFDPPGEVYFNQKIVTLAISAESGLPVQVVSTAPSVCIFPFQSTGPTTAQFLNPGTCSFKVTQPGDTLYKANEGFASFEIYPNPVKEAKPSPTPSAKAKQPNKSAASPKPSPARSIISDKGTSSGGGGGGASIDEGRDVSGGAKRKITCVKPGVPNKTVVKVNPTCPPGFKKK
jgi:hypothetical protein